MDKKILWKAMQERSIRRELIERIKEIYEQTKIPQEYTGITNWFWTSKGVRQGCPLSPLLFVLVITDVEEKMKKRQTSGILIGKDRIWTLTYADDLVLLAKNVKECRKNNEEAYKIPKIQKLETERRKMENVVF